LHGAHLTGGAIFLRLPSILRRLPVAVGAASGTELFDHCLLGVVTRVVAGALVVVPEITSRGTRKVVATVAALTCVAGTVLLFVAISPRTPVARVVTGTRLSSVDAAVLLLGLARRALLLRVT